MSFRVVTLPIRRNDGKVNLINPSSGGIVHQMRIGVYGTLAVGLSSKEFAGTSFEVN